MASTPTPNEPTTTKKAAPAKTAPKKAAAKAAPESAAKKAPVESPGQIIAERYRDTAYEALVGKNGENVSAVMSAGEAVLAGMAEVSQEMMTFAGDRLRQDMEVAEDFARATSPEELFEKQCSFAQRAAEQYAEETSKLIAMFARIQQSCWAPVQARTKETLHGLNGEEEEAGK
ncbi:phasin family protein [Pelagibius marinus]|uniref:phasin family protein n=1 Tax=Pelagibius marinus TaxID=2762760 RepID=UPI0018726572|nr:phasin family protein [Pelagibius marinus]